MADKTLIWTNGKDHLSLYQYYAKTIFNKLKKGLEPKMSLIGIALVGYSDPVVEGLNETFLDFLKLSLLSKEIYEGKRGNPMCTNRQKYWLIRDEIEKQLNCSSNKIYFCSSPNPTTIHTI